MDHDLHTIGKALSAPSRSAMVGRLLDGQAHTSSELASAAAIASSTASEHLAILVESGLVSMQRDGRFRRYRIADVTTAEALEALSRPVVEQHSSLRLSREQRRVRAARTCYDHLAGQLGVAVFDGLVARRWLSTEPLSVSRAGCTALNDLGIDVGQLERGRRELLRRCTDWTERRDHLAGSLGAALASVALERRWVSRVTGSRALRLTPLGKDELAARLRVSLD